MFEVCFVCFAFRLDVITKVSCASRLICIFVLLSLCLIIQSLCLSNSKTSKIQKSHDFFGFDSEKVMTFRDFFITFAENSRSYDCTKVTTNHY